MSAKPNFFIIGAPRCGTTSLADLLAQHPEVYFCPEKEPRFFSHDGNYERGFKYYEELFEDAENHERIGEGSTTYSHAWLERREKSARRIRQYCPSARILYCVRHPLRQIESAWLMIMWALDNGHIQGTELHRTGSIEISGTFNDDVLKNDGLVGTANFWRTASCYREKFSDEQIKIVFLRELKAAPDHVLSDCCRFLGIAPDFSFEDPDEARNASETKGLATTFGHMLRAIPGYRSIAGWSPSFLKTLFRPLIKDSFTGKPEWEPDVQGAVVSEIGDDTESFLKYAGKPRDYWSLRE